MTCINIYYKDYVRKLFENLAKDPYSYLWHVVGDFEINGHEVSITRSTQMHQVIIDNIYVNINPMCSIVANGITYDNSIDYAMFRLGF